MLRTERSPTQVGARELIAVNLDSDIRDLVRIHRVDVYSGDVFTMAQQKVGTGVQYIQPELIETPPNAQVGEVCKTLRQRQATSLSNLWHLVTCAPALLTGHVHRIIAFGSEIKVGGVVQYPVVGLNGQQRYIGLVRADFFTTPNCRALAAQVMAR